MDTAGEYTLGIFSITTAGTQIGVSLTGFEIPVGMTVQARLFT